MGYALREGLTFCETGGRLVFLDILADRYFGLAGPLEAVLKSLVDGGSDPRADDLVHAGLLVRTADPSRPRACGYGHTADASLLDKPGPTQGPLALPAILVSLALVRRALGRGKLHRLIEAVRLDKTLLFREPASGPRPGESLERLARTFEQTARLTRSHDQCLARSIVLARRALARNLPVDLVIGVRAHPFAAHSWVQAGNKLVNDRVDTVRAYTPILAL